MAKASKQACLTLYPEIQQFVPVMTDQQLGALLRALVDYRYNGNAAQFDEQVMQVAFIFLASQVDRMEEVKKRNTDLANRRWGNTTVEEPTPLNTGMERYGTIL